MTMPTDEQMPAAIAELMGWRRNEGHGDRDFLYGTLKDIKFVWRFSPMTDRNHSRLAVERCAELNLTLRHIEYLYEICREDFILRHKQEPISKECLIVLATPAQETRAAWRTLNEAAIRAAKEKK